MTISWTSSRFDYAGNGSTTVFSFPRKFFASTDLKVYLVDAATGVATLQSLVTHYTVAGAGSPSGGSVTMLTAPPSGKTLSIVRDTPATQGLDLDNVTAFPMASVEDALDRAAMISGDIEQTLQRVLTVPVGEPSVGQLPPLASRAGRALGFDANGNPEALAPLTPEGWQDYQDAAATSAASADASEAEATTQAGLATTARIASEAARDTSTAQAGLATAQAILAADQVALATTARTGAETARDAAFVNANVYASTSAGLAAVADGVQFQVVSGNQIIRYVRTNSTTATEVARYPAASAVNPLISAELWRGKQNRILDPFFRLFNYPTDTYNGGAIWDATGQATSFTTFSKVDNAFYTGFALRKTGNTELTGVRLNIADVGLVAGDTVAFGAELAGVAGQTCTLRMYIRCYTSTGTALASQVTMLDSSGASGTSIAAGTKVAVSASFTIPATTAYIRFYPGHTNVAHVGDVVSLWGVKGTAADLPAAPPLTDNPVYVDTYNGITPSAVGNLVAANAYSYFKRTNVSYSGLLSVVAASSYTAYARALTFYGWGTRLTPAGVSFNAIRVPAISRTATTEASKWATLNVVIRTGLNSQNAGSTIIAVGSSSVNPNADTLTNVIIVLKDPSTGAVKTLTDADFSGSEYGVMVYALNSAGAAAACGECRGNLQNFQGNSYYVTTTDAKVGLWMNYTSGQQMGYEHLLLTAPVETIVNYPTTGFVSDLQTELSSTIPAPDVVTPPFIFGVQGRECNVYWDNLFFDDASRYNINFDSVSSSGQQQEERWTWTPTGAVTTGNATLAVNDKRTGSALVSKTIAQRSAASSAQSGTNKKVSVIGDSLVNAGTITQTLLDIAAGDVMGVTLIGTRGTGSNKHEGRGGYTITDYTTVGRTYYSFTVSGVTVAPAINATEYSHNGAVYRVQEVSLTGGAGSIVCSVTSGGAPLASGTLTKSNGSAGDATITFSASAAVSGNPFWKSGAVNYAQYLTDNSLTTPDWVFVQLGTNDVFSTTDDVAASVLADAVLASLDTLITSIKAAGASIKVGLMIPPPPAASQDAFGANYATGQTRWRYKRNILIFARQMIAKYTGQEASRIYLVPSNTSLDTVNNFTRATAAAVNSRNSSVTVARQNNGVHPDASGYQQIGDALWAFLKYYG